MFRKKQTRVTEFDIIKEVGSICACNSTLAFSQMINRPVQLGAPELSVVKFQNIEESLQSQDKIVVGVHCQILSGVLGQVSLLFLEKSAYEFVSIFATQQKHTPGFLTQLGVSTIKEIGNVVVSAYSGAMSLLMDVSVIPSIPILSSGPLKEVVRFGLGNFHDHDNAYVHTMVFRDEDRKICGSFYLILEPKTVKQITTKMRKQLKDIIALRKRVEGEISS